jgi:PAS domain S-box-containing protein
MRSLAQNGSTNSLDGLLEQIKPAASLQRIAEALNRSEAYLATAQRLTQTGSWAIRPGAERANYWSEETFRIYECSASEGPLSPEQLFELVHPEDRESYSRVVGEGIDSGRDWSAEFRIVLPSGRTKYLHAEAHPILDESGSVREWVGAIVDVSQRRTAEEALERSQVELRNALEAIPAMAWTADPDGTNAFVSRRWAEYAGLPAGQTRITAWEDVVHPDDAARSAANWVRCVETGDPFEEELRLRRAADGRYRWFLDRGVAIRGKDGAILKWYGVATDIDDRKQAEAMLSAEKRLLRMIATGAPLVEILTAICTAVEELRSSARASVLMLDTDGARLNLVAGPSVPKTMAQQMVNLPIGPNAGPCGVAVHQRAPVIISDVADDAFWKTPMASAMASQHGIRASWSTPILSPKGDVVGTVGIYCSEPGGPSAQDSDLLRLATDIAGVAIDRDRVQRLEIEREAAIAQERSRLAGEIHDTLAQGLAMIVMQVADAEAKLGHAWSLAEKPLSTVRELAVESLAYARRSLNTLQPRATMVDLSVTLQGVVNKLRRHSEGSLTLSVVGSPMRIDPAVESALAGIATEALTNAVKHSKAMRIVAELDFADRGAVRIVVSDDGVGFDAADVRAEAYGLVSMQERATRAGVALTFVTEPGAGTTIVASWSPKIVTGG